MSLCASNQLKKPSEKSSIQFSKRNSDGERDAAGRRKGQNNRDIIGIVSSIGLQKVNGERRSLLNIKKRNSNTSINESNHLLNESDSSTSISSMQKLNSYRSLDVVGKIQSLIITIVLLSIIFHSPILCGYLLAGVFTGRMVGCGGGVHVSNLWLVADLF